MTRAPRPLTPNPDENLIWDAPWNTAALGADSRGVVVEFRDEQDPAKRSLVRKVWNVPFDELDTIKVFIDFNEAVEWTTRKEGAKLRTRAIKSPTPFSPMGVYDPLVGQVMHHGFHTATIVVLSGPNIFWLLHCAHQPVDMSFLATSWQAYALAHPGISGSL